MYSPYCLTQVKVFSYSAWPGCRQNSVRFVIIAVRLYSFPPCLFVVCLLYDFQSWTLLCVKPPILGAQFASQQIVYSCASHMVGFFFFFSFFGEKMALLLKCISRKKKERKEGGEPCRRREMKSAGHMRAVGWMESLMLLRLWRICPKGHGSQFVGRWGELRGAHTAACRTAFISPPPRSLSLSLCPFWVCICVYMWM